MSDQVPIVVLDNHTLVPDVWRRPQGMAEAAADDADEGAADDFDEGAADDFDEGAAEVAAEGTDLGEPTVVAEETAPADEAVELADIGRFRVFNPSIVAVPDGYAMAYRVVDETHDLRRLATCRLTKSFEVVPGSITPLSDLVTFADPDSLNERALTWHADPRFLKLRGRIYLLWNDGGNKPTNHQFLLEMTPDGLCPAGSAREVTCDIPRRSIEKNWMMFETDEGVWATYSICPHVVLSVDLDQPTTVPCRRAAFTAWSSDYEQFFGVLRGSAQPARQGDAFLTIAHSSYKTNDGRKYRACFYRFAASRPFRLIDAASVPMDLPNPKGTGFDMPRLNDQVSEVVYPCGFMVDGDTAIISYGLNDEACAITTVDVGEILKTLGPVATSFSIDHKVPPSRAMLSARNTANGAINGIVNGAVNGAAAANGVEAQTPSLPMFWWDAQGKKFDGAFGNRKFAIGNFGDIASMAMVGRITAARVRPARKNERKLLSIGSILHTAGNGDVIWGTGVKGSKMALDPSVRELSVHAVRGPLTVDLLRRSGIDLSRVKELFDPGSLIPLIYRKEIEEMRARGVGAEGGVKIVPHYRDDMLMRRQYFKHARQFVSVDATPLTVIENILGAERVVSSSLHGVIFAEALGIPACWLAPVGGEDELKFYDYYYGTGRFAVKRFETLEDALRGEPMPLPTLRLEAFLATFPHEEVADLAAAKIQLGEQIRFSDLGDSDLDGFVSMWNLDRRGAEGLWATAANSRLKTRVTGAAPGEPLELRLMVRPFNPEQFRAPQRIEVNLNGETTSAVEWAQGVREPVELMFRFNAAERYTPLELAFHARNARSPRSLGFPNIEDQITVCLTSLMVNRAAG